MLCCPTRIKPVRGLSRSAISASTTAIISGDISITSTNLWRMLYPVSRQANTDMNTSINQIASGMRVSCAASLFSLKSIESLSACMKIAVMGVARS
jgi:hypothetical protein